MLIAIAIAEKIQGSKMIALVPEPSRGLLEFSAPHVSIVFDDLVILSVEAQRGAPLGSGTKCNPF